MSLALNLALTTSSPPSLQEATKHSTQAWQAHLEELFKHAKDRFPDVVWELTAVDDDDDVLMGDLTGKSLSLGLRPGESEEVWGHKAIVYARAPPSFQTRYFSFRPQGGHGTASPVPYAGSPSGEHYLGESALSLGLEASLPGLPRSPSPFRSTSPSNTLGAVNLNNTTLLRLTTSINPTLFANELEYLYTGQGFGEAFEFLFDSSDSRGDRDNAEHDPEAMRIDKLRKDLVFMWRSRLYSDVRIALTGNFSSSHENTTAIFSSHRFILVSRSSYFHTALLAWPSSKPPQPSGEPPTLTLPSPPFTPASLHFTLGFIYTGTLIFSHRTYDLSTAFAILRAALYLNLPSLHDEIQARIAQEMLHGLFHAFITFNEYESLTNGKWGTGGCRCRQCARRAPRVLEFALADDVKNPHLERGARRALVGLFGEGWCTQEFAGLSPKIHEVALKGLAKRTTPANVLPLLFAAEHAFAKLGIVIEPWGDVVRDLLLNARKVVDEVLCRESEACFSSDEWNELMEGDAVRFEDGERVEWVMAAVLRGVKEAHAPTLYNTLVSSILLRPHPTEVNASLLPATSHIRDQVEETRIELLKWIGKRWLAIRQERGFDPLESWALKEISDHIEVPTEDLLNPVASNTNTHNSRNKLHAHPYTQSPKRQSGLLLRPLSSHPHTSKVDTESDAASSMRVSVLSRSLRSPPPREGGKGQERLEKSSASVKSFVSSTSGTSVVTAASANTVGGGSRGLRQGRTGTGTGTGPKISPAKQIVNQTRAAHALKLKDRPDSKLTPTLSSVETGTTSTSRTPSIIETDVDGEKGEEGLEGEVEGEQGHDQDEDEDEDATEDVESEGDAESRTDTQSMQSMDQSTPVKKVLITRESLKRVTSHTRSSTSPNEKRPKSPAASVKSRTSVARKSTASYSSVRTSPTSSSRPTSRGSIRATNQPRLGINTKVTTARPTSRVSNANRPISSASTATDSAKTYRTASTGLSTPGTRSRRTSAASTMSTRTAGGRSAAGSPEQERTRRVSTTSVSSVASTTGSVRSTRPTPSKKAAPPVPALDPTKLAPSTPKGAKATPMQSSRSGGSIGKKQAVAGTLGRKSMVEKKSSESIAVKPVEKIPSEETKETEANVDVAPPATTPVVPTPAVEEDEPMQNTASTMTIKPPVLPLVAANLNLEHKKTSSSASTASTASSSSVATLKRKGSSDTIKTAKSAEPPQHQKQPSTLRQAISQPVLPQVPASIDEVLTARAPVGATLDIGIPCIISSKRKRFKAYARYIGEVAGERGPWVGVEVPMPVGDAWDGYGASQLFTNPPDDDRAWNDGSWGGIRYFEIGGAGAGSEWDYGGGGDDRASRRRRTDGGSKIMTGLKRDRDREDQLSIGFERERLKRMRSVSPSVSDASGTESRGLFVRPQQVLYVVDAVGADL